MTKETKRLIEDLKTEFQLGERKIRRDMSEMCSQDEESYLGKRKGYNCILREKLYCAEMKVFTSDTVRGSF